MAQTLETIKGGGGSIRVGTTGTVGALMTREIENTKPASVPTGDTTSGRLKVKTSVDEASSSGTSSSVQTHKCPETPRKAKSHAGSTHQIPMLTSDNAPVDGTPVRKTAPRRRSGLVEIVDIKCRNPDKTWVTNRLKKLGFSKLSDNAGTPGPNHRP